MQSLVILTIIKIVSISLFLTLSATIVYALINYLIFSNGRKSQPKVEEAVKEEVPQVTVRKPIKRLTFRKDA